MGIVSKAKAGAVKGLESISTFTKNFFTSIRKEGITNIIRKEKTILASLVVLLLIVISLGGYGVTKFMETPTFCADLCHSMKPYGQLFLQSGHAAGDLDYKCMECHGEVRLGPIRNKYAGTVYSHVTDGAATLIAFVLGREPNVEFDPDYPRIPSERCLRCHAPSAITVSKILSNKNAYPVTAEMHSKPINVSEEFEWVLNNPRGSRYQCKVCHPSITHPKDGELLPTGRGEKYNFTHPDTGLPLDAWTQIHWWALRLGTLNIEGELKVIDRDTCKREDCHTGNLEPENMDRQCQGCHSEDHTVEPPEEREVPISARIPNINDYIGVKGETQ